jgi:hypothetical protein
MPPELSSQRPINRKQLRRLHGLWHRWAGRLALSPEADRRLRHYYVEVFTSGRVHETCELSERDAVLVIEGLAKLAHQAEARTNQAAGTAGRQGYPERTRIAPNVAAWHALWACTSELDMTRAALESFVRKHYSGVGLRGLKDIRSMADLNRVLWGLKAMLRRREAKPAQLATKRAA